MIDLLSIIFYSLLSLAKKNNVLLKAGHKHKFVPLPYERREEEKK